MKNMKKFLNLKSLLILALIVVVFLIPSNSARLTQKILCMVCCYAALGLSWNVISGLCGMFSVTRQEFVEQAQIMSLSFTEEELDLLFPAENQ